MSDDLSPREVAEHLGVTVRTVQRWVADGHLPATRVGSRARIPRAALGDMAGPPAVPRAIRSLLVANRGEIAARVTRTAGRMGMRVIGVHTAGEPAPRGAQEAHEIESYLSGEELIAIAHRSGADAVHPGYGFLAENPAFADAVVAAGLIWVGPPAAAIAAMGDKAAARRRAAGLGVPTIPGYDGAEQDDATLRDAAARIGFPLLVKPSAGGGGKGMRVVSDPSAVEEALVAARREARRSFGDDRLILERHLAGSRHVEIQVMFDAQGHGVHLGERDCSTQRRNQKIVEEAPAPAMTPGLRRRMGDAAVTVAAGVGYASAGTVEMLLTDANEFFFLEMNTRLQVEHPVTEEVTGRDLVSDQLRIAAGATLDELGLGAPPRIRGHAIEARVYAEDPEAGFLPATGSLVRVTWPEGVRVDEGISQGDRVTDRYDPMLAKLIAHGATRDEALGRLASALDRTTILGVRTNLRFLRWLVRQEPMRDGRMRTDTVATLDLPEPAVPAREHWQAAAAALVDGGTGPWADGWRLNAPSVRRLRYGGDDRSVMLPPGGEQGGTGTSPEAVRHGSLVHVDVDGQSGEFALASAPTVEEARRHATAGGSEGVSVLVAPMPGRVIAVRATQGTSVRAHQPVVIIEAMKMEHAVVAPIDGTVARLDVVAGQQVQRGDALAEVAADD